MDINRIRAFLGSSPTEHTDKTDKPEKSAGRPEAPLRSDSVGDAVSLDEALKANADDPKIRQEKVEQIKVEVSAGTYNPDTRKVAEAVARELFM